MPRLVLCLLCICAAWGRSPDHDRDGLDDRLEQALLERFIPRFAVSAQDCDERPAEFRRDHGQPVVAARNGTIYGQVTRYERAGGAWIELHYYHLWSRDCGRLGHRLDAEHVSALLTAPQASARPQAWRAAYWYAAAHEGTMCDVSHGARAEVLDAVTHGPAVWIAADKHASFLDAARCGPGCGADRCDRAVALAVARLVNLGEPGRPLNGADWVNSRQWPLAEKLQSDFSEYKLALMGAREVVSLGETMRPAVAAVSALNAALDVVALGHTETGGALANATERTKASLRKANAAVRHWLRRR